MTVRSGAACGGVDAPLTLSCRHAQANVEAASNKGTTALMFSAKNGHDSCVRQLLNAQVCACVPCVREREGGGLGALMCCTPDAGAFGGVCVFVCQGASAVSSGLRWG